MIDNKLFYLSTFKQPLLGIKEYFYIDSPRTNYCDKSHNHFPPRNKITIAPSLMPYCAGVTLYINSSNAYTNIEDLKNDALASYYKVSYPRMNFSDVLTDMDILNMLNNINLLNEKEIK